MQHDPAALEVAALNAFADLPLSWQDEVNRAFYLMPFGKAMALGRALQAVPRELRGMPAMEAVKVLAGREQAKLEEQHSESRAIMQRAKQAFEEATREAAARKRAEESLRSLADHAAIHGDPENLCFG